MTEARPLCAGCGAPYGHRQTTQDTYVWNKDEPRPQYRGNKIVVKDRMIRTAPHNSTGGWRGVKFGPNDNVADRELWDGQTWIARYRPFCTLRCALEYARKAYAKANP